MTIFSSPTKELTGFMSPYHNNSLREDNALAVFGLLSVDFLHGEKPDVVTEQVSLLWWQKAFSSSCILMSSAG